MVSERQHAKAAALRSLHEDGIFVLPNAWDAGSAAMIAAAGAPVIATTSAGVSWSLGRQDGQRLSRPEATDAVRRIADAVDVPVTADIEGGYGSDPGAVAATVAAMTGAGAVGINLEDSGRPGGGLFDAATQAARIRAARAAATDAGLPELVINARTDVFLFEIGEPAGRLGDVLARAAAYAEAGADSLFVPGLLGPWCPGHPDQQSLPAGQRHGRPRSAGRRGAAGGGRPAGQPGPGDHPGRLHPGPPGRGRGSHGRHLRLDHRR